MTNYKELPYYRTEVPIVKTEMEIEKLLQKYGLEAIRFTKGYNTGVIEFIIRRDNKTLPFRFKFNLPDERRFQMQVFRALYYYLKARFSAVDFGINTVEQEFMSELILKLPNGAQGTIREIYGGKIADLREEPESFLPFKGGS